jgi:hypothetical protein
LSTLWAPVVSWAVSCSLLPGADSFEDFCLADDGLDFFLALFTGMLLSFRIRNDLKNQQYPLLSGLIF